MPSALPDALAALRGPAKPLAPGFPRLGAYFVTYPANAASLAPTLDDFRSSDWGGEFAVVTQPERWPRGKEAASRTYKRALEQAAGDGCDFALILEDDVRVCHALRRNLLTIPLVARDQCDYLGLFIPDLIQSPWERREPHLGYRLAKPLYSGPNTTWEKFRVWGSQAYLLSRRFVLHALSRWGELAEGQDARVLTVCRELQTPLWYPDPCLVEHAPLTTAFGTPDARAPDFDPECVLEVGPGFQPPEAVPGWLAPEEGQLLWQAATGRRVLELGTQSGRATVCMAQSAAEVVSVSAGDQSEASEWVRRYGLADRVRFRRGGVAEVCRALPGGFDLALIDGEHDAASVTSDIAAALPLLAPGGRLAFHDYPDPGWPEVRRTVDDHAQRLGWRRIAQEGYLAIFQS